MALAIARPAAGPATPAPPRCERGFFTTSWLARIESPAAARKASRAGGKVIGAFLSSCARELAYT